MSWRPTPRRVIARRVEFLAVTFRESREAVRAFAGDTIDVAVIEPEVRAVLAEFEEVARHFDVVSCTGI